MNYAELDNKMVYVQGISIPTMQNRILALNSNSTSNFWVGPVSN